MKNKRLLSLISCIYLLTTFASADARLPEEIYSVNGTVTSIAGSEDYVVFGLNNSRIYLFDKNGDIVWIHTLSDAVTSVALSSGNDFIASTTIDDGLYLLNIRGGVEWHTETTDYPRYGKGLYVSGDMIALGDKSGYIHFFQGKHEEWSHRTDTYILEVRIDDNLIKAVSDKRIYIFNLNGRVLLNKSFPVYIRSAAISERYIAVGLGRNNELCLIDNNGNILLETTLPDHIGVIDVSDYIACGLRNGEVHIFNTRGERVNRFLLDDSVVGISTLASKVVASTSNKNLYLLNAEGDMEWSVGTEGGIHHCILSRNYLFAGSNLGNIYYLGISRDPEQTKIVTLLVMLSTSIAVVVLILSLRY